MSGSFVSVARAVASRASELLHAPTLVVDREQTVVAASDAAWVGRRRGELDRMSRFLRVPLKVGSESGEVEVGEPQGDEYVPPHLAQVVMELVIGQAALQSSVPAPYELKNKFIYDLLRGVPVDEETRLREARILGLDLSPPRAVILVDASEYILGVHRGGAVPAGQVERRAQLVIGAIVSFFRLPNDTICAYIGAGEIAVLKASDTKNLTNWVSGGDVAGPSNGSWANLAALKRAGEALLERLRADTGTAISVGIGRYHRGLMGLARSYQDARAALLLGRRFQGGNRVHCLDALGMAAFVGVSEEQTKVDLARHLLSPLDAEPELIDTLEAFFEEDCRMLCTAKRLGVHRNTLNYRLDKIAVLTGMDPRRFDQAVQIRLALLLRSLQGARPRQA
ncbi:carbohydrate diacid regulator [Deinobacterium chartae]|uniref:Carbohydrate diacid regulator n=1 Tax=Deinobacterium chartae TaxID=521158 RepID=A0A841HV85_9DEIO|nr:helix-turn-helix domain-containing protein [Deinobacterium chartae]MBB6097401.1 carbohydrate diacid regulator [Deinobacterium chartae]